MDSEVPRSVELLDVAAICDVPLLESLLACDLEVKAGT